MILRLQLGLLPRWIANPRLPFTVFLHTWHLLPTEVTLGCCNEDVVGTLEDSGEILMFTEHFGLDRGETTPCTRTRFSILLLHTACNLFKSTGSIVLLWLKFKSLGVLGNVKSVLKVKSM